MVLIPASNKAIKVFEFDVLVAIYILIVECPERYMYNFRLLGGDDDGRAPEGVALLLETDYFFALGSYKKSSEM